MTHPTTPPPPRPSPATERRPAEPVAVRPGDRRRALVDSVRKLDPRTMAATR